MTCDFGLSAAFEKIEHKDVSLILGQLVQRFVEMRLDLRPRRLAIRVPRLRHRLFSLASKGFTTHDITRTIPSHPMQPSSHGLRDAASLSRQLQKRLLGDIMRCGLVSSHPQRRGMNHRPMRPHQLMKGVSIARGGIALEVLEIGKHCFS